MLTVMPRRTCHVYLTHLLRCDALQAVEVGQYLDDQGITLRIDPSDGKPYTKAQFVGLYRGTQEWDAAAPAPAPAPAAPAAPAPAPAVAAPAVEKRKGKTVSDGGGVEAELRRQRTLRRRLRALEKSREKTERTIEREVNSSWLTCDQITALARSVFALCSGLTRPVFLPSAAGCTAARTVGEGPGCRPPQARGRTPGLPTGGVRGADGGAECGRRGGGGGGDCEQLRGGGDGGADGEAAGGAVRECRLSRVLCVEFVTNQLHEFF